MKKVLLGCSLALVFGSAHASPVVFNFNMLVGSELKTVATLSLTDGSDAGGNFVLGKITHFAYGAHTSSFISGLYLNIGANAAQFVAPTSTVNLSNLATTFHYGNDAFSDSSYRFDAHINLPPPPGAGGFFTQGKDFEWKMYGVTAGLFANPATPNNQNNTNEVFGMIHVQSLANGNSVKLFATSVVDPTAVADPVPEPFTMGLVAAGALAAARRVRAKKKA